MPDQTPNLDPKEATEAKLCAYLEGELAPSERAEIEQHLAANPQHRHLLSDLAKTREWMRAIPTESSPVDLAEIFQGQVERSMLLDHSETGMSRMMARWPQYAIVAAVLLLTVGLGIVVVAMLKGPKAGESKTFSLAPASATSAPATEPVVDQLAIADRDKELAKAKAPELPVAPTVAPVAPVAVASGGSGGGGAMGLDKAMNLKDTEREAATLRRSVSDASTTGSVKARLLRAGYNLPLKQKTVCFVLAANSPGNAMDQVRGFFNRHTVVFDDALSDKRELAQILATNDGIKSVAGAAAGPAAATTEPLAMNAPPNALANASLPGGQVPGLQSTHQMFTNAGTQSQFAGRAQNFAMAATTAPTDEGLYVAYGLTPLQLELLSASLETDNLNQSVQRATLSEGVIADKPAMIAAVGAVVKGQSLTVTVPQLVGPGIEKSNVVKVAEDGTITLPMIDPLPAAGALPAELQQRIADKYREANLIPQATVTVAVAAPASTQATATTTQPSTQPTASTTQPAPQEAGINVVVLIEKNTSILPK